MALIKCPECGREISDKAESCPGCGCPASEFEPNKVVDTRSELDKIADEIFWDRPKSRIGAKRLSEEAGISRQEARDMLAIRMKQYKVDKKAGKLPDTQYCPHCGSIHIEPYESGFTMTSHAKSLGGLFITSGPYTYTQLRCQACHCRWTPKEKKY